LMSWMVIALVCGVGYCRGPRDHAASSRLSAGPRPERSCPHAAQTPRRLRARCCGGVGLMDSRVVLLLRVAERSQVRADPLRAWLPDVEPGADHADRGHPPGRYLTRELLSSLRLQRTIARSAGYSRSGPVPAGTWPEQMITISSLYEPTSATAGHAATTAPDGPWPRPCASDDRSAVIIGHRRARTPWSALLRYAQLVSLGPRTHKSVESPQIGRRLNTPRWFFPLRGEFTGRSSQVPSRTQKLAGNPAHAPCLIPHAGGADVARIPAAGPGLLLAGRQP
jgi:hypothetical protein